MSAAWETGHPCPCPRTSASVSISSGRTHPCPTRRGQGGGTFDRPGRWVIVVTLNETMLVGMVDVGQGEGAELVLAGGVLGIVGPGGGIFVGARGRGRGRERLLQQRGTRAERRSHPSAGRGGDHDQE